MTTPLDLDAIEARAEAATEGPWHYDGMPLREDAEYGHIVTGGGIPGSMREHQICWVGETLNLRAPEDAAFTAAARTDVPALLAEVKRLRSALERVTDNFRLAVAGKPVRDMAETLAEVEAALTSDGAA